MSTGSITIHLYFQKSILGHGFPGIPGSNGIPGMPGVPGPQGPQGIEGARGQIGDKGSQGMPGPRGDRGREGPPGKSGPRGIKGIKGEPGLVGMKGEPGIVGNQGRKGDKGGKGESPKASQASVVPQTNWKQCVWKSASGTDNGKIKVNKELVNENPLKDFKFTRVLLSEYKRLKRINLMSQESVIFNAIAGLHKVGTRYKFTYYFQLKSKSDGKSRESFITAILKSQNSLNPNVYFI